MYRNISTFCTRCNSTGNISVEVSDFTELLPEPIRGMCTSCASVLAAEEKMKFAEANEIAIIAKAKLPPEFLDFDNSRGNIELAKFVWNSRKNNMLIFGKVGTGKTRCVCRVAREMLLAGSRIEYWDFQELSGKYSALNQEGSDLGRNFIKHTLNRNEVTIIDDIDKKKYSDSVCELLYAIFDGVYSGIFRGKIWITANFANGAEMHRKFSNGDIADAVCSRVDRMAQDGRMSLWR